MKNILLILLISLSGCASFQTNPKELSTARLCYNSIYGNSNNTIVSSEIEIKARGENCNNYIEQIKLIADSDKIYRQQMKDIFTLPKNNNLYTPIQSNIVKCVTNKIGNYTYTDCK